MQTFRLAAILNGIVFCGVLLSACALGGNFAEDFQSARKLYYSGKAAEAEFAGVGFEGGDLAHDALSVVWCVVGSGDPVSMETTWSAEWLRMKSE